MKLTVNSTARRYLKIFILIFIGSPIAAGFIMILSIPTGLSYYLFVPMLYFLNFYFTPVHAIFGDYFVRISEFGMNPQGIRGYVAAICFYAAVSYAAANILALFRSKNTHADPSGESEPK